MRHATQTHVVLEVSGNKLRPVVGNDPWVNIRKGLSGSLNDELDIFLRHRLLDFPVRDKAAVAIQDRRQVKESPGNIDVRHIDMPVLMWHERLHKARPLQRWLA